MQVRSIEWVKNGSCIEFGRELQGRNAGVNVFNANAQGRRDFFLNTEEADFFKGNGFISVFFLGTTDFTDYRDFLSCARDRNP